MSKENASASLQEFFGDPISIYTREQAIDDGVLVDVTDVAKEAGFRLNTCVTHAVWEDCYAWSEDDDKTESLSSRPGWQNLGCSFHGWISSQKKGGAQQRARSFLDHAPTSTRQR